MKFTPWMPIAGWLCSAAVMIFCAIAASEDLIANSRFTFGFLAGLAAVGMWLNLKAFSTFGEIILGRKSNVKYVVEFRDDVTATVVREDC